MELLQTEVNLFGYVQLLRDKFTDNVLFRLIGLIRNPSSRFKKFQAAMHADLIFAPTSIISTDWHGITATRRNLLS